MIKPEAPSRSLPTTTRCNNVTAQGIERADRVWEFPGIGERCENWIVFRGLETLWSSGLVEELREEICRRNFSGYFRQKIHSDFEFSRSEILKIIKKNRKFF